MKDETKQPEKYELEPKVYLNITKKGFFTNEALLAIIKLSNYGIHWLQPLAPELFGYKNQFNYFPYQEKDLLTFIDNYKPTKEDFAFHLSHNSITVCSYYYMKGASYLKITLSYEHFNEHQAAIIANLDDLVIANNITSLRLEHGDCFDYHKNRSMINQLNNPDYDYHDIVFEVFKEQKYYRVLGNDIKDEAILTKALIGVDKEYLAAHDHYCYKEQIWLGISWLMYFNIEEYQHYINLDKLLNYQDCHENTKLNQQYQRITLYPDMSAWQDIASIDRMWTFRAELGIDEMAHKLLALPYPYLTSEELRERKEADNPLISIEHTEHFDYLYYYFLFHINNNFAFCYNRYIDFLKDLTSYKYHFSPFQLSENRDYYTISLATYTVELAYDSFDKKILDFSYNTLVELDDIIKQYRELAKKNAPSEEQKFRTIECLAAYLIMVLVVNEGVELVSYGKQKPIGYLEINGEPIDVEVRLNKMIFDNKKGLFFQPKQDNVIDYYNEIVAKISRFRS